MIQFYFLPALYLLIMNEKIIFKQAKNYLFKNFNLFKFSNSEKKIIFIFKFLSHFYKPSSLFCFHIFSYIYLYLIKNFYFIKIKKEYLQIQKILFNLSN